MKKKILFVHHGVGIGGAPISMIKTINKIDNSKYSIKVLLLKDSNLTMLLKENSIDYEVIDNFFYKKIYQFFPHIVPSNFKWFQIFTIFKYSIYWLLSRFIFSKIIFKTIDADIVHFNSIVLNDFLFAASKNSKVVLHVREPLHEGYLGIRKNIIKHQIKKYANSVIAISVDNSDRLGLPEKTTIVYNFIEISKQTNIKNDSKKVLYLGGDDIAKGFLVVNESLKYLDKGVKIIFAGNYNYIDTNFIRKIVNKMRLIVSSDYRRKSEALSNIKVSKNAEFVGLLSNVNSKIDECQILISPFTKEHFARPVIEAFARGKPVIASDVKGMSEILDNNINGILVKNNDAYSLAQSINMLAQDIGLCEKFGKEGYKKANLLFSEKNVQIVEKIYENLIVNKIGS